MVCYDDELIRYIQFREQILFICADVEIHSLSIPTPHKKNGEWGLVDFSNES